MNDYSKITALYSRLSVGDEDRDGGESNSIVVRQIKRGCFRQIKTVRQEASGKHHVKCYNKVVTGVANKI